MAVCSFACSCIRNPSLKLQAVLKYNCVWVVDVSRFTGLSDIRVVFMAFTSVVLKTQTSNWKQKDGYVCWSELFKMPTQLKEQLGIYLISTLVSSAF
jgi:hypothetical protein